MSCNINHNQTATALSFSETPEKNHLFIMNTHDPVRDLPKSADGDIEQQQEEEEQQHVNAEVLSSPASTTRRDYYFMGNNDSPNHPLSSSSSSNNNNHHAAGSSSSGYSVSNDRETVHAGNVFNNTMFSTTSREPHNNNNSAATETTCLLTTPKIGRQREQQPRHHSRKKSWDPSLENDDNNYDDDSYSTPYNKNRHRCSYCGDTPNCDCQCGSVVVQAFTHLKYILQQHAQPVLVGSCISALYHVVFCLAQAAAVTRSHGPESIIGLIVKMAALGTIVGASLQVATIGTHFPSLYPCVDKFVAPFLAQIASAVDESLYQQSLQMETSEEKKQVLSDATFLATFCMLTVGGFVLASLLCLLAYKFRLANVGSYLPNSVISGFFSSIGLMLWTLAFAVDNGGMKVQQFFRLLFEGDDWTTIQQCLLHHLPSLVAGISMRILAPKHPLLTPLGVIVIVCGTYAVMFLTHTTLEEARNLHWFWKRPEMVYPSYDGFDAFAPPAPLGYWNSIRLDRINWQAARDGLPTTLALAFLYAVRTSLHSVALKKNLPNMLKKKEQDEDIYRRASLSFSQKLDQRFATMFRSSVTARGAPAGNDSIHSISSAENQQQQQEKSLGNNSDDKGPVPEAGWVLYWYAISHLGAGLVGGFGCIPSLGAGTTLFRLGAGGAAPQYGGVILLFLVYWTEFEVVRFIPKMAFSSLLVLSGLDLLNTWFVRSFRQTRDFYEWTVVPLIMILTYVVGLLQSVGIGIGIATFIFVAAFFRSGVVKFVGNGLMIRSSIERLKRDAAWLNQNGDLIQILVLQNYLFFGNASSCLVYIRTMFEEPQSDEEAEGWVPEPKYLVIDLTLVTGMDTSAVDVFKDIATLLKEKKCRFFMTGVSPTMEEVLALGGVKPAEHGPLGFRWLRFFPDLDIALGKAEDRILTEICHVVERDVREAGKQRLDRLTKHDDNGFLVALAQIDDQHGTTCAQSLAGLRPYASLVELSAGETLPSELYGSSGAGKNKRGLFFIEHGLMRLERDEFVKLDSNDSFKDTMSRITSISDLHARSSNWARKGARMKRASIQKQNSVNQQHAFRVGRIGPGYVVGDIEGITGLKTPGLILTITECRLHYIPYSKFPEIESIDPRMMLSLYKVLGRIVAEKHDTAVEQLSNLRSIMSASPPTKPVGRSYSPGTQFDSVSSIGF